MTLSIDYVSANFPAAYSQTNGVLSVTWDDLLWSALTIGRPSIYDVFQHGQPSLYEAVFRLSLVRMAVEQGASGHLLRTDAFSWLDPTEKGMVSYFLGMAVCKLFSSKLLAAPWLLHLDVYRAMLNPNVVGGSRPDLVGKDRHGDWHAFECKGRSSTPSSADKDKAKDQAMRLVAVGGSNCLLHIGSLAFFRSDQVEFYWRDPTPVLAEPLELPFPEIEWRHYYEPSLRLALADREKRSLVDPHVDVHVEIHPEIEELLIDHQWLRAHEASMDLAEHFESKEFQPDGLRVTAGTSWYE